MSEIIAAKNVVAPGARPNALEATMEFAACLIDSRAFDTRELPASFYYLAGRGTASASVMRNVAYVASVPAIESRLLELRQVPPPQP